MDYEMYIGPALMYQKRNFYLLSVIYIKYKLYVDITMCRRNSKMVLAPWGRSMKREECQACSMGIHVEDCHRQLKANARCSISKLCHGNFMVEPLFSSMTQKIFNWRKMDDSTDIHWQNLVSGYPAKLKRWWRTRDNGCEVIGVEDNCRKHVASQH